MTADVDGDGAADSVWVRSNGLRGYRTELSVSGLLWTAVGDATKASEVREVWTWSLDEGPGVVATGQSCLRFPDDGSDPTFSAC